jgi:hypothetical protein
MKFSAGQYLAISDRIVEKAVRCPDVETMGRLLTRANLLWHRARRLGPPTSIMPTPLEIAWLRHNDEVGGLYFRAGVRGREEKPGPMTKARPAPGRRSWNHLPGVP